MDTTNASPNSDGTPSPSVLAQGSLRKRWEELKQKRKPQTEMHGTSKYRPVPYWHLFRYASNVDKAKMFSSLVVAGIHGALIPVLVVTFGSVVDDFEKSFKEPTDPEFVPQSEITGEFASITNLVLGLAFAALALAFVQLFLALTAATSIGNEIRKRFFSSLISQDCDFYDDSEAGAISHLVVNDITLIQDGIGDKLTTSIQYVSTFVVGLVIGFVYGWKLALVILAITSILVVTGVIFGNASAEATGEGLGSYAEAGGKASETLSMIRTVTAFGGQEEEARRYETSLEKAYKSSLKAAIWSGLGLGVSMFIVISSYALAFWSGSRFVEDGDMSPGDVLLTFLSIAIGASTVGTAGPAFKAFGVARAAAPRVFEVIERKSAIDPLDKSGLIPAALSQGRIIFEDVDFDYRTRITETGDSKLVLDKFNLDIPVGSSEALVGKSGCGKSTIARLILRLYETISGRVLVDGFDIRELNVRWLRSQIGIVSQNPSLFRMSIRDNIALGAGLEFLVDEKTGETIEKYRQVSDDDIIAVAKLANADGFISRLPEGYNTALGDRGAMLSGGQKQRICIARALIRDPKILILDESTASLDTANERIVQEAIEKAATGRTTITIAHRLSTVKNATSISCIDSGTVIERGCHRELISRENGFYKGLFELQNIEREKLEKEKTGGRISHGKAIPTGSSDVEVFAGDQEPTESTKEIPDNIDVHGQREPAVERGLFWRTLRLNRKEWPLILFGTAGAVLDACVMPLSSIPLVQVLDVMLRDNDDAGIRKWCLAFVILGGVAFIGNWSRYSSLGVSGEKLTRKLRSLAFRSLLKQEMGYFDLVENSLGAVTGRLSADAGAVKGLTGDLFGVGVQVTSSLLCGLIIAYVSCWRLALVMMAILPGLALGGYMEVHAAGGLDSGLREDIAVANASAAESVDNVSTVRQLGVEDFFYRTF